MMISGFGGEGVRVSIILFQTWGSVRIRGPFEEVI
jgi:hypothetical protein